ncbi:MAG: tryptophan-rich sensory protein [Cyanobacteria bacterium SIG29]|nr:tryptophan-rich sensory protein [Cyanobacteria bacterium SIG29]
MYNSLWYDSLNKPFLNPPDWIFPPVWGILYIMITLSFLLFLKGGMTKEKKIPFVFFIIQLILNFAWSPIFFVMQNIPLALATVILMYFFILLTIITFFKHSKLASLLLVPYLIWVSFATYLNFGFLVLN